MSHYDRIWSNDSLVIQLRSKLKSRAMRPVPILMYHRLGPVREDSIVPGHYVTESRLKQHLLVLKLFGKTSISLAQMVAGFRGEITLPKKPVVITFDDGYESFFTIGLPQLKKFRQTATVFVVTDLVGGKNEWDLAKGDVLEPLMTRDQILRAQKAGIEFGSHTRRHADLAAVNLGEAQDEIETSRANLAELLGAPPRFFCYPYGSQNDAVRGLVRAAGYDGATSTRKGGNGPTTDPYDWGRINVRANTSIRRLARQLFRTRDTL
jgi:peptidoglycan/xylan/chitin deacetylase (PgdA/CDA1 family)